MPKIYKNIKSFLNTKSENNNENDIFNNEIIKLDTNELKHAVPIENNRKVLSYICSNVDRSIRLSSKLKDEFTKIFGHYNKTFRGEFLHYIWILSFKNEIFEIFTSNRGTTYELVCSYEDIQNKEDVCIEFLKEIEKLLNNIK